MKGRGRQGLALNSLRKRKKTELEIRLKYFAADIAPGK